MTASCPVGEFLPVPGNPVTRPGERLVTLRDGRRVSSYSEAWRLECEAHAICHFPTQAARRDILATVERRRGKPARIELETLCRSIWDDLQSRR